MKICQPLVAVTFIAAAVCLALVPAPAAQTLSILPDSTQVSDGTEFTLEVAVSGGVTELMGWDIAVTFDSEVLELLSVDEGSLPLLSGYSTFFFWYDGVLATDSVHVNGAILGDTVDGPGTLFTLTFKGHATTDPTVTYVNIGYSLMRTGVNMDIAHDVENARVEILLGVSTEVTSWGAIKSMYAGH
jgi:hypothetical protein